LFSDLDKPSQPLKTGASSIEIKGTLSGSGSLGGSSSSIILLTSTSIGSSIGSSIMVSFTRLSPFSIGSSIIKTSLVGLTLGFGCFSFTKTMS